MQVKSVGKYLRISPRKVERVLDLIKGKSASQSLTKLRFMPQKAAELVLNVLKSAIANAKNNYKLSEQALVVSQCYIGYGTPYKRFMVKARGRIHPIKKRTSHITIYVSEGGSSGTKSSS